MEVKCPVKPGEYSIRHEVTLPKEIPPGRFSLDRKDLSHLTLPAKFTIDVKAYTDDDSDMLCLKLQANFMKRPSFPKLW